MSLLQSGLEILVSVIINIFSFLIALALQPLFALSVWLGYAEGGWDSVALYARRLYLRRSISQKVRFFVSGAPTKIKYTLSETQVDRLSVLAKIQGRWLSFAPTIELDEPLGFEWEDESPYITPFVDTYCDLFDRYIKQEGIVSLFMRKKWRASNVEEAEEEAAPKGEFYLATYQWRDLLESLAHHKWITFKSVSCYLTIIILAPILVFWLPIYLLMACLIPSTFFIAGATVIRNIDGEKWRGRVFDMIKKYWLGEYLNIVLIATNVLTFLITYCTITYLVNRRNKSTSIVPQGPTRTKAKSFIRTSFGAISGSLKSMGYANQCVSLLSNLGNLTVNFPKFLRAAAHLVRGWYEPDYLYVQEKHPFLVCLHGVMGVCYESALIKHLHRNSGFWYYTATEDGKLRQINTEVWQDRNPMTESGYFVWSEDKLEPGTSYNTLLLELPDKNGDDSDVTVIIREGRFIFRSDNAVHVKAQRTRNRMTDFQFTKLKEDMNDRFDRIKRDKLRDAREKERYDDQKRKDEKWAKDRKNRNKYYKLQKKKLEKQLEAEEKEELKKQEIVVGPFDQIIQVMCGMHDLGFNARIVDDTIAEFTELKFFYSKVKAHAVSDEMQQMLGNLDAELKILRLSVSKRGIVDLDDVYTFAKKWRRAIKEQMAWKAQSNQFKANWRKDIHKYVDMSLIEGRYGTDEEIVEAYDTMIGGDVVEQSSSGLAEGVLNLTADIAEYLEAQRPRSQDQETEEEIWPEPDDADNVLPYIPQGPMTDKLKEFFRSSGARLRTEFNTLRVWSKANWLIVVGGVLGLAFIVAFLLFLRRLSKQKFQEIGVKISNIGRDTKGIFWRQPSRDIVLQSGDSSLLWYSLDPTEYGETLHKTLMTNDWLKYRLPGGNAVAYTNKDELWHRLLHANNDKPGEKEIDVYFKRGKNSGWVRIKVGFAPKDVPIAKQSMWANFKESQYELQAHAPLCETHASEVGMPYTHFRRCSKCLPCPVCTSKPISILQDVERQGVTLTPTGLVSSSPPLSGGVGALPESAFLAMAQAVQERARNNSAERALDKVLQERKVTPENRAHIMEAVAILSRADVFNDPTADILRTRKLVDREVENFAVFGKGLLDVPKSEERVLSKVRKNVAAYSRLVKNQGGLSDLAEKTYRDLQKELPHDEMPTAETIVKLVEEALDPLNFEELAAVDVSQQNELRDKELCAALNLDVQYNQDAPLINKSHAEKCAYMVDSANPFGNVTGVARYGDTLVFPAHYVTESTLERSVIIKSGYTKDHTIILPPYKYQDSDGSWKQSPVYWKHPKADLVVMKLPAALKDLPSFKMANCVKWVKDKGSKFIQKAYFVGWQPEEVDAIAHPVYELSVINSDLHYNHDNGPGYCGFQICPAFGPMVAIGMHYGARYKTDQCVGVAYDDLVCSKVKEWSPNHPKVVVEDLSKLPALN